MHVIRVIISAGLAVVTASAVPVHAQVYEGQTTVIDGDTLEMTGVKLRLFGIDALEAHQTCNRNGEDWQCGEDATARLRALVSDKTLICAQRDIDPYGRIVAKCTVEGRDLAQEMVRTGLAVALPKFTQDYVEWENLARLHRTGIWASEFQMPVEFRASAPQGARDGRNALDAARRERTATVENRSSKANSSQVYYHSCAAARAAGAAPIYRGQSGYRAGLDRDNDGIACEPYRGQR